MWRIKVHSNLSRNYPELQIGGGIEDNSEIIFFFLILNENMWWPSVELSRWDGPNDGSQNVLKELYVKLSLNYPFYPYLFGALIFAKTLLVWTFIECSSHVEAIASHLLIKIYGYTYVLFHQRTKGKQLLWHFLFHTLDKKALSKWDLLLKSVISFQGSKLSL